MEVGVISDTHGLLRPEAVAAMEGVDLILHAGDIGSQEVVDRLRELAPVRAVRGNIDKGDFGLQFPEDDVIEAEGDVFIYMLHNLAEIDLDPEAAGFQVVVSGHSHVPELHQKGSTLYLNPGSAGPRRFKLPVAVAKLTIQDGRVEGRLVTLFRFD